jgi:hypothetical protein
MGDMYETGVSSTSLQLGISLSSARRDWDQRLQDRGMREREERGDKRHS